MATILDNAELKKIYSRYPALARTRTWGAINEMVEGGRASEAWALADKVSKASPQLNAQNVTARRLRLQRVKFFALQVAMAQELKDLMRACGGRIGDAVRRGDGTPSSIKRLRRAVSVELGILRRAMNKWATDGVWNSVELGMRNIEAALVPIFKDNEEGLHRDVWLEMNLMEERLSFGLSAKLVGSGSPSVAKGSNTYWQATDKAYRAVVAQNNNGLQLSTRIWDLTKRAELDMQRLLETKISGGASNRDVARAMEEYLLDEPQGGAGVYTKPMSNAMRIARTETNRAYASAQAEWAKTRGWVKGMMITLSSAHDGESECECEANAGKVVSPEEFAGMVPFHPHCMCYGTIVIKDEYLEQEESYHGKHAVL
jgi:hypothetical protein